MTDLITFVLSLKCIYTDVYCISYIELSSGIFIVMAVDEFSDSIYIRRGHWYASRRVFAYFYMQVLSQYFYCQRTVVLTYIILTYSFLYLIILHYRLNYICPIADIYLYRCVWKYYGARIQGRWGERQFWRDFPRRAGRGRSWEPGGGTGTPAPLWRCATHNTVGCRVRELPGKEPQPNLIPCLALFDHILHRLWRRPRKRHALKIHYTYCSEARTCRGEVFKLERQANAGQHQSWDRSVANDDFSAPSPLSTPFPAERASRRHPRIFRPWCLSNNDRLQIASITYIPSIDY